MPYPIGYQRPRYVSPPPRYSKESEKYCPDTANAVWNRTSLHTLEIQGIPDELSFNRIMSDSTRPPCTSRDFMDYLLHIEHSAENLQFYLWFQNYEWRFGEANTSDTALSPAWTKQQEDDVVATMATRTVAFKQWEDAMHPQLVDTSISSPTNTKSVNLLELPRLDSPLNSLPWSSLSPTSTCSTQVEESPPSDVLNGYEAIANEAYRSIGLVPPFSIQPFRQEINLIIATYIAEGGPRQLNLHWKERSLILHALVQTTHPTAFRSVYKTVDDLLRRQSHPNFIRWAISNGNPPRVIFGRALGIFLVLGSIGADIVLTLSRLPRGWRALPVIGMILGWSIIICAWKGICVVLLGMHARHVRPWELYEGAEDTDELKRSFETIVEKQSYEAIPWKSKYDQRSLIRRTLERQVWIQEPAMRRIQDIIFWKSMLQATSISGVLICIFLLVPGGNYF